MTLQSVIFDLDGTLTDSGEGIINSAAYALEKLHIPVPPRETMRVFVGPPLWDTFRRFGVPDDKLDTAVKLYRERYIPDGMFENHPYAGIREMLQTLEKQGTKLYVATSKPEATAVGIMEHFDLARYFSIICGASEDQSRSSKDAVIAYLLRKDISRDGAVMVGDTEFDILGAAAHGIQAIGVSWGYGSVERMRAAGAAAIADSPEDLLQILRELP